MKGMFKVVSLPDPWQLETEKWEQDGVYYITLKFTSEQASYLNGISLLYEVPGKAVYSTWHPKINLFVAMTQNWFDNRHRHNSLTGAPTHSLLGMDDYNVSTIAFSECEDTVEIDCLVHEESGSYQQKITLLDDTQKRETYQCTLRIDERSRHFAKTLKEVGKWWEENQFPMLPVPAIAKQPVYSTWYSFHQNVLAEDLLQQVALSKPLGCKTLIIDDGWQTEDRSRGYGFCGDWQVSSTKIPDMAGFVESVHQMDVQVMLWYTVPFIGVHAREFPRFEHMLINYITDEWAVLDPRYPEVREFIINTYLSACQDWNIDGLKLDFIDEFILTPLADDRLDEAMDYTSVAAATVCLLKEMTSQLLKVKPELIIEYRQTFNTPVLRQTANVFRAVDCPLNASENRIRIADIRLLAGKTVVHSDMIMWDLEDTAEHAALQLINVLFSVPQISVLIDKLPESHGQMLSYYLQLWQKYQDVLLEGNFYPLGVANKYPLLRGIQEKIEFVTLHQAMPVSVSQNTEEFILVNGTHCEEIVISLAENKHVRFGQSYNCLGETIASHIEIKGNMLICQVPASGVIILRKEEN